MCQRLLDNFFSLIPHPRLPVIGVGIESPEKLDFNAPCLRGIGSAVMVQPILRPESQKNGPDRRCPELQGDRSYFRLRPHLREAELEGTFDRGGVMS